MNATLQSLYNFRVSNNQEEKKFDTRRKAAKQLLSWLNKGHSEFDLVAESRGNGRWEHDTKAFELMHKYSDAQASKNGHKNVKEVTAKDALRELAAVCKLTASTSEITEDHEAALVESINQVVTMLNLDFNREPEDEDDDDEE